MRDALMGRLDELRSEPTEKRIRGTLAGRRVIDSERAMLVWEPKRVTPAYAVPPDDIDAEVIAATPSDERAHVVTPAWARPSSPGAPCMTRGCPSACTRPMEAREVTSRIAFFNERVDLIVDGEQLDRPITPWSKR